MSGVQTALPHLPFFEALAELRDDSAEWRAVTAGLVTLRLFDAWVQDGADIVTPEAWGARAVREAIHAVDGRSAVRALLTSVVDAMAATPFAEVATVAPRLMAYARALQFDAQWALAADVYRTVLSHAHPTEDAEVVVPATHQLGYCFRKLARWDDAATAYAAAGELAAHVGDTGSVLRSRIASANLAIERGNLPLAEATLDDVIARAADAGLTETRSLALHDRAHVAHRRGQHERALRLVFDALPGFTLQADRDRALGDLASSCAELGMRAAARDAYLILSATAQEQETRWVATANLMELAALDGSEVLFEQHRRELAEQPLPAWLAAYYHYSAGKGHHLFGHAEAARAAYERARGIAAAHQLNQLMFEVEESVSALEIGALAEVPASAVPSEDAAHIAAALREMRRLAGVSG